MEKDINIFIIVFVGLKMKNGNVIYELKNGTGKVREYNELGTLIFEGEYQNGVKVKK